MQTALLHTEWHVHVPPGLCRLLLQNACGQMCQGRGAFPTLISAQVRITHQGLHVHIAPNAALQGSYEAAVAQYTKALRWAEMRGMSAGAEAHVEASKAELQAQTLALVVPCMLNRWGRGCRALSSAPRPKLTRHEVGPFSQHISTVLVCIFSLEAGTGAVRHAAYTKPSHSGRW